MMKRTLIIMLAMAMLPAVSNAQLGSLLQRAASKAVDKAVNKAVDKAADKAAERVEKTVEKKIDEHLQMGTPATAQTVEGLMAACPELPSVNDLVSYKEAELADKTLKMATSKVAAFTLKVVDLTNQVNLLGYESKDSAALTEMAYKYTESVTGLSREELDKLSQMSEAEQEAYLKAYYASGRAERAHVHTVVDVTQWLEPLQPQIEKWEKAGEKADAVYAELHAKLKPIHARYAERLAAAEGSALASLQLAYYTEAVPHIRAAVQKAMNIRLKEQLPLAEALDREMVKIRTEHPEAIAQLLNYPKLTAVQYFSEAAHLVEIPVLDEE